MKILFIKSVINSSYFTFDIGIGYLDAILKSNNHQTNLFILKSLDHLNLLDTRIELFKPDLIAFSTYASAFQSTIYVSQHIKKMFPKIHQVIGGIHLILNPTDWINIPSIDAVCIGEGELSFPEYINRLEQKNGSYKHTPGFWVRTKKIIKKNASATPVMDLDTLPFPSRDLFTNQYAPTASTENKQGLEFLFTRGCYYNCTYCSNHALKKVFFEQNSQVPYVRHMSPNRAVEWIKHDLTQYPAEYLCFHDDTFTVDKKWLTEFLNLYKKEIKIPFMCNIRVDTVNKSVLRQLKDAGCFIVYAGIESGDENLRETTLKRHMTNESIISVFASAKKIGLHAYAFLMIGLPDENPQKFVNTIKLVSTVRPNGYSLSIFYPYPGTELHEYCIQKQYLNPKIPIDFVERIDTPLTMKQFCREDILHLYHHFYKIIATSEKSANPLRNILRKIKFNALLILPSNKIYPLAKALVNFLDIAGASYKNLVDLLTPKTI